MAKARLYEIDGQTMTVSEICKKYKLRPTTFQDRIASGMSPESAAKQRPMSRAQRGRITANKAGSRGQVWTGGL